MYPCIDISYVSLYKHLLYVTFQSQVNGLGMHFILYYISCSTIT